MVVFLLKCVSGWWNMYDAGSDWSAWPAYLSFFRHIAGLNLPQYDKWQHYETLAQQTGPRIVHKHFWIASHRQTAIHLDRNRQLHHDGGPARTWADGWALNYWHGVRVPADFWTWDTKRALAESNSEIRRCAIERIGWDNITDQLTLVDSAPDPGNPGQGLRLYDLPRNLADMYEEPARILVCANASLDKGGHRRVFGLPVPAHHQDAVAAAADLFDIPVAAYRQLGRAA